MPLPNFGVNTTENPLLNTPFIQTWQQNDGTPPPGTEFRITNSDEHRVTNDGDTRITNT